MKVQLSLKGFGLQLLARREHSRDELRRKLLRYASKDPKSPADAALGEPELEFASPSERVEAALDWLQVQRYLDEERFVESLVQTRAKRFGHLRIRQELAQRGVELAAEIDQSLKDSELSRARAVWERKFGQVAVNATERGRQVRFLTGRGFSNEVIRSVVRGVDDD